MYFRVHWANFKTINVVYQKYRQNRKLNTQQYFELTFAETTSWRAAAEADDLVLDVDDAEEGVVPRSWFGRWGRGVSIRTRFDDTADWGGVGVSIRTRFVDTAGWGGVGFGAV